MSETRQKIVPHLWYNNEAMEAAEFYCSVFPGSRITSANVLRNTPSGDTELVSFELWGYAFQAISAGPLFQFNPSVSLMINFDPSRDGKARERLDGIWDKLMDGGKALMPLDKYPFSEHYGWVQDRYGLSWQLIFTNPEGEERPRIIPSLMFTGDVSGRAEEATDYYLSMFSNSGRGTIARYPAGMEPESEGSIMFTDFRLDEQWFAAMDSAFNHGFSFNEAISFMVFCRDQQEIDHFWEKLSFFPEAEQCGWLKDRYGLSWQIVPDDMTTMLKNGDPEQLSRVTRAFLGMKKFDLAELRRSYEGK